MQSRDLKEKYIKEIIPLMKEKFGFKNNMAVPKIKKVTVNVGIGSRALKDNKIQEAISGDLAIITGQKPVPTQARKAIAGFKVREGMVVGLKTTLRGKKMFEFLSRLVNTAIPRIRDFRGLDSKSIDQGGNFNIGIKEHIIFPEISPEKVRSIFGLEVNITTNSKKEYALELFKLLGFPIKHGKDI